MRAIKKVRLKYYDYSENNYYFVTICSNNKNKFLLDNERFIKDSLEKIELIKGVYTDYYIIMPDHIHMIMLLYDCKLKLGKVIRRFKAISSASSGIHLWQPNYYEHVIRNEKALSKIRDYVISNPEKYLLKFDEIYKETLNELSNYNRNEKL